MKRFLYRSSSAFSLVEIVIALGLVSFSLVAIFALVAQGSKTGKEARLESVAALLSGKVNSQLRASTAWDSATDISTYTGGQTLANIAAAPAGTKVTITNYYDIDLNDVADATSTDRQFALITEVGPIDSDFFVATDSGANGALSRLPDAKNTVFLNIEVAYPAQAAEANRSKRFYSAIITRTSKN